MHISSLSIRNYRNFRAAKFNFKKGINTIIGENGAGKTNLFQSLRILIDDSLPRYLNFYESDFNRAIGEWAGHWIIISVVFEELDMSEEAQALAIHSSGHIKKMAKAVFYFTFDQNIKLEKSYMIILK